MKFQFKTRTGSIYEVEGDDNGGTWKRIKESGESGQLRSKEGPYTSHTLVAIGHPVAFLCPPLLSEGPNRVVATSAVVEIVPGEGITKVN